jgi:hypothetical protein
LPGAFQGLVHGVSRWGSLAGKLGFCASSGKSAPLGSFRSGMARFDPDKTLKRSLAGLSKAALRWYIPLAPRGIARVAFSGSLRTGSIGASGVGHSVSVFCEGAQWFIAGWSSPVARQAHNLKVTGSNPVPATRL